MNEPHDNDEPVKTNETVLTEDCPRPVAKSVASNKSPRAAKPGLKKHHFEDEEESFWERYKTVFIFGAVILVVVCWLVFGKPLGSGGSTRRAPEQQIVKIVLPPLPPPPPPPPKATPPPKEDKRPDQAPMAKPDAKPEAAKPKPADKPPEGLGTNIKGAGPGLAGLGSGGGNGILGGTGSGPGGGSQWGWYAGQVQTKIAEALRNNSHTRGASINIQVRVWPDNSGKISRVQLTGTTGNNELDNAIKNEVLTGLKLQEPPPQGMPVPIVFRLVARRPN